MGYGDPGPCKRPGTGGDAMKAFLFYGAELGATLSITLLAIGLPIRNLVDRMFPSRQPPPDSADQEPVFSPVQIFIRCPACVGFWISAIASLLLFSPTLDSGLCRDRITASILDGLVAVAVNWVAHVALTRMGQYDL